MISLIKKLVKAYIESDAEMIEINPCALTPDGKLIAADAKVSIDDSAMFRHKEYVATSAEARRTRSRPKRPNGESLTSGSAAISALWETARVWSCSPSTK